MLKQLAICTEPSYGEYDVKAKAPFEDISVVICQIAASSELRDLY